MTTPIKSFTRSAGYILLLIALGLLLSLASGCGQQNQERKSYDDFADAYHNEQADYEEYEEAKEDHPVPQGFLTTDSIALPISSSAASTTNDNGRLIARTATVNFRVNDVAFATLAIEDMVAAHKGLVTFTELQNEQTSRQRVAISEDSSLVITRFLVTNDMRIRVPNEQLDSTLRGLIPHIDQLDLRRITADDRTLKHQLNQLAQKRLEDHQDRMKNAIDHKGKKLKHIAPAEGVTAGLQAQSDQALINNLRIEQQVSYSTIHLHFYQRERVQREIVENPTNYATYQPGLGSQLLTALETGWEILKLILLTITRMWSFILLGFGGYFGIRALLRWMSARKKK